MAPLVRSETKCKASVFSFFARLNEKSAVVWFMVSPSNSRIRRTCHITLLVLFNQHHGTWLEPFHSSKISLAVSKKPIVQKAMAIKGSSL